MVFNKKEELIYTSRAPIPSNKENKHIKSFKQVCVYGFKKEALKKYSEAINKTPLEEIEDLELLRFVETGEKVKMVSLSDTAVSVDNPEDILKVEKILEKLKKLNFLIPKKEYHHIVKWKTLFLKTKQLFY